MRQETKKKLEAAGLASYTAIHDAPDEDLRKLCAEVCYDEKLFRKRIRLKNSWYQLLNTHITLDHIAQEFLSQELPNKGVLKIDRWGLQQKAELLFAMGAMTKQTMDMVLVVNSLRNKAAHQHGFQVEEKHVDLVLGAFPDGFFEQVGEKPSFRNMMIVIVALFEAERQEAEFRALKRKGALANARRVLEEFQVMPKD